MVDPLAQRDCDRFENAAARAAVFRLLARLWAQEISRDLAEQLSRPPVAPVLQQLGDFSIRTPVGDDDLQQWAVDFCQLFIGPRDHLLPYQSVWDEGRLAGDAASSMRTFFDVLGYQSPWDRKLMDDHLAVQLDVMGHLLEQAASQQVATDEDRRWLVDLLIAYVKLHLTWPDRLLDRVARRAATPLYQSLAAMTATFLQQERRLILSPANGPTEQPARGD